MDLLYRCDQNMEENDMADILDNDVFDSPSSLNSDSYMDNDWFNALFEDPVLNDKMITDAVQPPRIQSEHSYSINNNDQTPISPLGLSKLEDLDAEFFGSNHALDLTMKALTAQTNQPSPIKLEPVESEPIIITGSSTDCQPAFTVSKKPTIILATPSLSQLKQEQMVLPKIAVKQEPPDMGYDNSLELAVNMDSIILPPTPPGSSYNSSDSDGSLSPQRSAPSSPIRHLPQTHHISSTSPSARTTFSQPLFTSPIPQSGILMLSEEEKRTLISEGYPVPAKLPLTKQEEKNLKKIRRKIKNKISAQESRRKKKEYMETLEKRVEAFTQENCDLRKKVDGLENNNRSLLSQLQKLQSIVSKVTRQNTSHTGTALMVLVLCFAVFVGSWGPTSLNIGYSSPSMPSGPSFLANPQLLHPAPRMGPSVKGAKVDAYSTPNMRSRVLLSSLEESDDMTCYGPNIPKGNHQYSDDLVEQPKEDVSSEYGPALAELTLSTPKSEIARSESAKQAVYVEHATTVTVDQRVGLPNDTSEFEDLQATMHPDIAAPADFILREKRLEKAAEFETA